MVWYPYFEITAWNQAAMLTTSIEDPFGLSYWGKWSFFDKTGRQTNAILPKPRVQIIYCWYFLRIIIFVFVWVNHNSTVFLNQNFVCNLLLEFLHFKQQSIPFHHLKRTYPLNNSMFTNVEHKMYFSHLNIWKKEATVWNFTNISLKL